VAEPMSYSVDTRLVKCADCGWEGRVMDCTFRYRTVPQTENVEGTLTCPKCDSKNLMMINGEMVPA